MSMSLGWHTGPEQGTVLGHGVNLVHGVAKPQQEQEGK